MRHIVFVHLYGFPDLDTISKVDRFMLNNGFHREILGEQVSGGELASIQLPSLVYFCSGEDSTCEGLATQVSAQMQMVWPENRIFAGKIVEWVAL